MGKNRVLHLCALLLMVFLVVSAMLAVPAEAGRALVQTNDYGMNPNIPRGRCSGCPYTRPCTYKNRCDPPHDVHVP
ncbi:hypothetical protein QOZ80_2BG0171140 [Eleusine coracana subsp. coracana]|nr:hypothetical protein QOZ80_2BG0171140 [Eleusine coracana subsp. coracana]